MMLSADPAPLKKILINQMENTSMVGSDQNKQREIDENYVVFSAILPELMKNHAGKFVVMRHKQIVLFFDTARDAMVHGTTTFDDGLFSVQEVTDKVVDLGWFSHAPLQGAV